MTTPPNDLDPGVIAERTSSPSIPAPPTEGGGKRVLLLIALLVVIAAVAYFTGATEYLTRDRIRGFMTDLGAVGFLLYLALFCVGELIHIPGMVFMIAAVVAYGPLYGGLAAFGGGMLSVSFTFFLVRRVGGQPLGEIKWPIMKRVLELIDDRPIPVVAALRLLFTLSPVLNYALAMTHVRFRDYFIGSLIGFLPWAIAVAVATEKAIEFFG